MIVSKTPFRMSFVGGGSDIASYYRDEIGAVLSTSINRYMYICVNPKFDRRIRLNYSRTEEVDVASEIEHPLVREALQFLGISSGIEISSLADIPSYGSGLGSSSSYTVGLLHALHAYCQNSPSKSELARQACEIEIDRCGEPIGKQDQFAAAMGGLNYIQFNPDDTVDVQPVNCSEQTLNAFQKRTLVFYTGRGRSASAVLAEQYQNMKAVDSKSLVRRMVELAGQMRDSIEIGHLDEIGPQLDENWHLKRQLAAGITDSQINEWYEKGIKAGASGGKLLGAGNGGFIMFYAPLDAHEEIRGALSDLRQVDFGFDRDGTNIICRDA